MGRAGCDGWRAELERPHFVIYIKNAGSEGKRIGQRSDSKSDVQKWIVGSNPMPSAGMLIRDQAGWPDRDGGLWPAARPFVGGPVASELLPPGAGLDSAFHGHDIP